MTSSSPVLHSVPILALLLWPAPVSAGPPTIDFQRDVRPILTDHCVACHGLDKARGGLKLTDRKSALESIVPGKPEESELILRLITTDAKRRMPPIKQKPLSAEQIDILRRWIAAGASWADHWAWQPLGRGAPPSVRADGGRNPIDTFVLSRLEARGIRPSPPADRYTLIRRLSYDLLGLPPSIDEVDAFVHDRSPHAYERLVDRLLASAHFGERWGRHWLDLAHYADSDGYEKDRARPDAPVYRDWVITAINDDMPFDRFTIEQLAGDLLPAPSAGQKVATAFFRQTLTNEEGGVDQEEFRIAAAFDRTETVGTVWLGVTLGCVRCHSHKYDPFPQEDYYRLFAFFNNTDEVTVPIAVKADRPQELEQALRPVEQALARRYTELAPAQQRWEAEQRQLLLAREEHRRPRLPRAVAEALEMYPEKRVAGTRRLLFEHYVHEVVKDEQARSLRQRVAALHRVHRSQLMDVRTLAAPLLPRQTHIFNRGDFLSPGKAVRPGTPQRLPPLRPRGPVPDRLDLARWLVSRDNFLTPRVAVNQVWKHLFGEGLVRSPGDFGTRGEAPTHPELLDWLAQQFQEPLGWSRKRLIRLIVTSATYQQSSRHRVGGSDIDPVNLLLARQARFRVEAEVVRDLQLAVGGLLARQVGGASVFPPMPEDLAKLSYANNFTWKNSTGSDRHRRGLYTFFKRTVPHPALMLFDAPDANVACVRRNVSNTPLQALLLLNNESHVEAAQGLAARLLSSAGSDIDRLDRALRLCVARPAQSTEIAALREVLEAARRYYAAQPDQAARLAPAPLPARVRPDEVAAWVATVRVVLNTDEFLTRE